MMQITPTDPNRTAGPHTTTTFESLTAGLRPAVKQIAQAITTSQTKLAILTFFRCQDQLAFSAYDLGMQVGRLPADVSRALTDLIADGLIEREKAGSLPWYRLTRDEQRRRDLEDAAAWQEFRMRQACSIAQAAGACLLRPLLPDASVLPAATVRRCMLS
jgi:hypothetical protein